MSISTSLQPDDIKPASIGLTRFDPITVFRRLWAANWALTLVAAINLGFVGGALVGLALDHRVITGMPAWLKPMKFAISVSIYSFTCVELLSFIKSAPRLVRFAAGATAIGFIVEIAVIFLQAARGTTSHFNNATPLDAALFGIMGMFIALIWLMNLVAAILILREKIEDRTLALGLAFGLWVTLLGAGIGILMVLPTSEQVAAIRQGEAVKIMGAHSVGVTDGGPGIPVVGWSSEGGDFRPAHFVGLHAMQLLPLFAWLVSRGRGLGTQRQSRLVWAGGLAYVGVIILLLSQALRGQSIIAPDLITVIGFLGLMGALGIAVAVVILKRE